MITGLLSTPEYIRASLAHSIVDTRKVITKKLERQEVLHDTTKRFTFILTEQAVRWPLVPPAAMAIQIGHLVSITYLSSVRLGVIPVRGHMPIAPMETFTIYDDVLTTVETTTGVVILRGPRDIAEHLDLFSALEGYALFGEQVREQMSAWSSACRS
ncbi:Scr1 family TA system antitoxin-like transcriptional regulator [Streptomyces sparsogenes]|uniref:Putative transcriptional regulator n=1 Tax=Streptomyces sparsogenes DSM 40356 TaxID=1331668 RepID=A0A1R1SN85_9ACTN|nr:putative transcriptional regulator [Streptomyces sparsogenes DSM 40356]